LGETGEEEDGWAGSRWPDDYFEPCPSEAKEEDATEEQRPRPVKKRTRRQIQRHDEDESDSSFWDDEIYPPGIKHRSPLERTNWILFRKIEKLYKKNRILTKRLNAALRSSQSGGYLADDAKKMWPHALPRREEGGKGFARGANWQKNVPVYWSHVFHFNGDTESINLPERENLFKYSSETEEEEEDCEPTTWPNKPW